MNIKRPLVFRLILPVVCLLGLPSASWAQDYLSADEAVRLALENNYDVRAAGLDRQIAEINTSNFNTGKLPTVQATAGADYQFNRALEKVAGVRDAENTNSFPFTAGVSVNYALYDASRKHRIGQLGQLLDLSDLQLRRTVEQTVTELLSAYYRVAQLEQDAGVKRENLEISRRNLLRSQYAFEYGVVTNLAVLNSEVNVNNDSIAYQLALVEVSNARRDLNVLLGRDPAIAFSTDSTITFIGDLSLEQLLTDARANNVFLLQADQQIAISETDIELARSGWMPSVNASGGYNWRQQFFVNQPIDYLGANGFTGGLTLAWNIFDGGRTKTAVQRSQVALEGSRLFREEIARQIERNVLNDWQSYENALLVVAAQQKNIETSQSNFDRTAEKFRLGNITTTEYREAQTNLLNAKLGYLQALYAAKVYEIRLLQLAGSLVN